MSLAVHLRSAVCLLGRFPALAGVDLDVRVGEVVLLAGPNGAGKTTLLRACAGLVPVVDGRAVVLGHDLRVDRRSVRSLIGLVGHATSLYDDLSVFDNVRFTVRARGGSASAVGPALERLGLDGRLRDVPVARLSAGQRRRCTLASLVACDAPLWLLDEPHAGLDREGRDLVDQLVADAAKRGRTVIMASHDLERAAAVASRQVTIEAGTARRADLEQTPPPAPAPAPEASGVG